MDWQPIHTAPMDGTWMLGLNDAGNCAVIIRSTSAVRRKRYPATPDHYDLREQFTSSEGWIFPFSFGEVSPFWEDARVVGWMPLPDRGRATVEALIRTARDHRKTG